MPPMEFTMPDATAWRATLAFNRLRERLLSIPMDVICYKMMSSIISLGRPFVACHVWHNGLQPARGTGDSTRGKVVCTIE